MSAPSDSDNPNGSAATLPNGPGAAAILAAGVGSAMLGILALASDASPAIKSVLSFYSPAGALSGVTTIAIVVWLVTWLLLFQLWRNKEVALSRVNLAALAMLGVGFLLTFPPFMDLLQGK
ncbi:MAG: hypothetical protein HY054_16240 [Proteobacteria bacterium]|nr:hypothetical protein [Pseudomonadota bacterium]